MFDWAIAGVNFSLPGEGGPECAAYLPLSTRIYESVVVLGVSVCVLIWARYSSSFLTIFPPQINGYKTLRKTESCHEVVGTGEKSAESWKGKHMMNMRECSEEEDNLINVNRNVYPTKNSYENDLIFESIRERNKKNWLLVLLCLIWGAEIGFKFASRTVIYVLNPCHVVTAVQIYLLAVEPSYKATVIFRMHLYYLNGAILAFLFPNTESRILCPHNYLHHLGRRYWLLRIDSIILLPCETSLYWIQHSMMLVVPIYLLCSKGMYNIEPTWDLRWGVVSYAINCVYHFAFLQPMALISEVNLNQLLCPAQLDPFRGTYYRTAAVIHQSILCPLVAKACCIFASLLSSSQTGYIHTTDKQTFKISQKVNCDRDLCKTERASLPNNSHVECKSCHLGFITNINHKLDKLQTEVMKLDKVDENIVNTLDTVNQSEENIDDLPFQLRFRNKMSGCDKS